MAIPQPAVNPFRYKDWTNNDLPQHGFPRPMDNQYHLPDSKDNQMTRPTYGSLFSGVGGMDLGFDTHMDCVFQVEWDKHAQSILRRHWPDVPKWDDVQDVNGATLPPCDVLTFGSPCQDLSVAGKRAGIEGGRSSMFFEATRIIKEMRDATSSRPDGPFPRVAVWENVPGALSSNGGKDFGVVLDELAQCGALEIQWRVLDAQHFGVPQRRRRVFVVAIFDPSAAERCPDALLPVAEGRARDFAKGRKKGEDPAGGIEERFDASGLQRTTGCPTPGAHPGSYNGQDAYNDLLIPFVKARRAQTPDDFETRVEGDVTPTLNAFDNGGESRATVLMPIAYSIREDAKANTFSATETDTALCLNGLMPSPQSHHAQLFIAEAIPIQDGREMEKRQNGFGVADEGSPSYTVDTTGGQLVIETEPYSFDTQFGSNANVFTDLSPTLKASQSAPSVALTDNQTVGALCARDYKGVGNQYVSENKLVNHSYAVRRLTPLECERLMGWPDNHTLLTDTGKEQADTHRYKQCGNGVATPVARWIASHLKDIL